MGWHFPIHRLCSEVQSVAAFNVAYDIRHHPLQQFALDLLTDEDESGDEKLRHSRASRRTLTVKSTWRAFAMTT